MALTIMQKLIVDSVFDMALEGIESCEDKASRLTALKLTLSEAISYNEKVFLASCKTDKGSEIESNLWVCTTIIKEILDHPKPQLSYKNGGIFNLVRHDEDSGEHYPEVSAEEVKDYVRQKVAEQICKLEAEGVGAAAIPIASNKELMEAYIVAVQDGVIGFFNKLKNELYDDRNIIGNLELGDDINGIAIISGILLVSNALQTALKTDLGKEFTASAKNKLYEIYINALIATGVDFNFQDKEGDTALHQAVYRGYIRAIEDLAEAGADLNVQNNYGNTALHHAVNSPNIEVMKALIKAKADLNVQNKGGETALHYAIDMGNMDGVKALIKAGDDVNVQSENGVTALHNAAYKGNIEVMEALIGAGADLNVQNKYGNTASHIAAEIGNVTVINALVAAGADLNVQNKDGNTASHIAARIGNVTVIKAFAVAGADLNVQNKQGKTALHFGASALNYAAHIEDNEAINALIRAGDYTPDIRASTSSHILMGDSRSNSIVGGGGVDTISYANASGAVTVNINSGKSTGFGNDSFSGITNIIGSPFGNIFRGNSNSNLIFTLPEAEAAELPQPSNHPKNWQDLVASGRAPSAAIHNQLPGEVTLSTSSQMPEMALMGVVATLATKFVGRAGVKTNKLRNHIRNHIDKLDVEETTQKTMLEMHHMSEDYAKPVLHVDAALKIKPDDNDLIKLNNRIEKISELSKAISVAYDKGEFGPETAKIIDYMSKKQANFLKRYDAIITDSHAAKIMAEKPSSNAIGV